MQSWNQWGGAAGGGAGVYNYQSTTAPAAGTPAAPTADMQSYNSSYQYYSAPGAAADASQVDMSAYGQQSQTQQYTALQQQQWQQWTQWQQQFQQWQQQYGDKYQQAMQGGMQPQQPMPAALPATPSGGQGASGYNPSIQPPLPPLPPPADTKSANPPLPSEPPLPPPSAPSSQPPLPSSGPPPPSAASSSVPPTGGPPPSSSQPPPPPSQAPMPPQMQHHPPPLLGAPHQQPPPPPPPSGPMHHLHQGYPPPHGGQQPGGPPIYPPHNSYYGGAGSHPYDGSSDPSSGPGYYQSQQQQQQQQPPHHRNMGGDGGGYGGPHQYSSSAPYGGGDGYEGGYGGRKRPMGGGPPFGPGGGPPHGDKKMRMDIPPPSMDKRYGGEDELQQPPHDAGWGGHWGGDEGGGRPDVDKQQPHMDTSKPPPSSAMKPKEAAPEEELSEAEKSFDAQFEQWEAQFMRWKEQNKNHSDKNQYREYEAKWESWREQLLQRREQMKKKRENGKSSSSDRSSVSSLTKAPPPLPEKSPDSREGPRPGDKWWSREGGGREQRGRDEREQHQRAAPGGEVRGMEGGEAGGGQRFDGRWPPPEKPSSEEPMGPIVGPTKADADVGEGAGEEDEVVEVPAEGASKDKNGNVAPLDTTGALGLAGHGGAGKGIPGLDLVTGKTMGAAEDEGETKSEFMAREPEDKNWPPPKKDGESHQEAWFKRNWNTGEGGQRREEQGRGGGPPMKKPLLPLAGEEEMWKEQRRGPFGLLEKPPHPPRDRMEGGEEPWGRGGGGDMYRGGGEMGPGGPPMEERMPDGRGPMDERMEDGKPWNNQQRGPPRDMMGPPDGRMMGGRPFGGGREGEGKQPWQMGPSDPFGGPPGPGMHQQHQGMRSMDCDMRNEPPPPSQNWQGRGGNGQDMFGPPPEMMGGGRGEGEADFGKPWQQQQPPPPPRGGGQDMYGQPELRQDGGGRPPLLDTDARDALSKPWPNRGPPDAFGPGMRSAGGERGPQPNLKPGMQGLNKPGPYPDGPRFPLGEMRPPGEIRPPILPDPKPPRDEFDGPDGREGMYPRERGDWEEERGGFPRPHWHDDHPRNQRYDGPPRGEGWDDGRMGLGRPPMEGDPFDRDRRPFFNDVDDMRGGGEMGPDKGPPMHRGDHMGRPYGMEHGERFGGEMDDERWDYRDRHGMEPPMRPPPMGWDELGAPPPVPRLSPPPPQPPVREWEPELAPSTVIDYGHISRADVVAAEPPPLERVPTPPRNLGGSVQTFDYGHGNARNPVPFVMEYEERDKARQGSWPRTHPEGRHLGDIHPIKEQWRGNEYGDRDSRLMGLGHEPPPPPRVWDHDERSPSKGRSFEPPGKEGRERRESRWEKPRWSGSKHEGDLARWEEEDRYGSDRWGRGGGKERDRERDRERSDRGSDRGDRVSDRGDRGSDRDRDRDRGDRSGRGKGRSRGGEEERSVGGSRGHDSDKERERSSTSSSSRHKKDESGSGRSNGTSGGSVPSGGAASGGPPAAAGGGPHPLVSYPIQSSNSPPPPPIISAQPQASLSKVETVLVEDLLSPPGRANRPARIVIILRGPPGSGKTFVAKLIKDKEVDQGGSAPRILALDDYFMVEFEKEEKDPETGRKVTKKFMKYEYEPEMEKQYRSSLIKAFRKTVDDGYFPFIIVDCINDKVRQFDEMWTYAKQKGFQVFICEMDMDVSTCSKRNTHGRSQRNIEDMVKHWEETPRSYARVDVRSLLQSVAITEVEMEDTTTDEKSADAKDDKNESDKKAGEKQEEPAGTEEDAEKIVVTSKWEGLEASEEKLDRLDGLAKKRRSENHPQSLEDWLQLPDDYEKRKCTPGKKQVRWADLEERRQQERIRAIGFVVGQTDWSRMTDPTFGQGALTQTKYI